MTETLPAWDVLNIARLRSVPMFAHTSGTDLDSILRRAALVTAGAGEALVVEGDASDYAYVILSGTTRVEQAGDEIASLGAGDLFGETAMVAGGTRTATVRAIAPVELLRLDAQSVAETTGTQTIAWSMLQSLLDRLRRDETRGSTGATAIEEDAATAPLGEFLPVAERVVVAPQVGIFRPSGSGEPAAPGEILAAGQVIGFVDVLGEHAEVRSPFTGYFMGMLALDGERVRMGQPIAWLRTL